MLTATKSSRINISEEIKTKSIAEIFSNNIKVGDTIFLRGELGVGKTTFIRYLINFLQRRNNQSITEISSPTFNLVHEYQLGSLVIKHYDLYRINDEKELANIGIYEDNPDEITLIEWPEKMKKYKTNNILDLNFEYGDEYKKRFLTISSKKKVSFLDEIKFYESLRSRNEYQILILDDEKSIRWVLKQTLTPILLKVSQNLFLMKQKLFL